MRRILIRLVEILSLVVDPYPVTLSGADLRALILKSCGLQSAPEVVTSGSLCIQHQSTSRKRTGGPCPKTEHVDAEVAISCGTPPYLLQCMCFSKDLCFKFKINLVCEIGKPCAKFVDFLEIDSQPLPCNDVMLPAFRGGGRLANMPLLC